MRIVIAVGGDALLRRGEPMTTEVQRQSIKVAAGTVNDLRGQRLLPSGPGAGAWCSPVLFRLR